MGKGKRTKNSFELEKELLKQQQELEKKRKSTIKTTIISAIIILVGVAIIAGSFGYVKLSESGFFARQTKVISNGKYKVNASMMQYLFNTVVDTYETDYADYLDQIGLDINADLKDQPCTYSENEEDSWYDYFLDATKTQVEELLILCEKAEEEGLNLTEADEKYIDKYINTFKTAAEDNGQTTQEYLTENYGSIVSIDDVRSCYELTVLATKYQNKYAKELSYTDQEIESYFDDNKSEFLSCSYLEQLIENDASKESSDGLVALSDNEAKLLAEKIAKSKTEDEFKKQVKNYLTDTLVLEGYTKKEKAEYAEEQLSYLEQEADYDVTTDSGEWLFDKDRKAGDTGVFKSPDGNGYYVYYVTAPAEKDLDNTKDVRHILFSLDDYDEKEAEKKAKTALKEWLNTDRTEESFAELATLNTGDTGSVYTGGLYTNVRPNEMVDNFDSWIFDKKRKAGDTDVIKTDYGWHVMYFVGEGYTAWKSEVVTKLKDNDYKEFLEKEKEESNIKYNNGAIQNTQYIFTESAEDTTSELTE